MAKARHNELARLLEKARKAEVGAPRDLAPPDLGARDLAPYEVEEEVESFGRVRAPAFRKAAREARRHWPAAVPRFDTWAEAHKAAIAPAPIDEDPEPEPPAPGPFAEPLLLGVRKPLPVHPLEVVTQTLLEFYLSEEAPWREDAEEARRLRLLGEARRDRRAA